MSKTITEDISSISVSPGNDETFVLSKRPVDGCTIVVTYSIVTSSLSTESFTYGTARTAFVAKSGTTVVNGSIAYDGTDGFTVRNGSGSTGDFNLVNVQYLTDEDSIYAYRFDKSKVDLDGLFLSKQYVKEYAVGEEVIPQGSQRSLIGTLSAYYAAEIPAGYNILACSAAKVETNEGSYFKVPVYLQKTSSTPEWRWETSVMVNGTSGNLNITKLKMQIVYVMRDFITSEIGS